jgi:nucleotide-binding universal stress UspA family protein
MDHAQILIFYDRSEPARTAIPVAPTWEGILDVPEETGASAIVIGSHGRTGVREFVVGSVSHDLTQHSSLPVLIVPPQTRRH